MNARTFFTVLTTALAWPASAELILTIERHTSDTIHLTLENIPSGQVFHLRRSTDGVTFEPLFPPIEITNSTPQPIAATVDPAAHSTLLFQVYEGTAPFMAMVPVRNPGNAHDPDNIREPDTYGAVNYEYRIGKYEVTNAQYAEFLRAVAATDPNGLYAGRMGTQARGGIRRLGEEGSYTYRVRENMGDKPVNYVNWYDAARFCNWLHNGRLRGRQHRSTTEGGAYTLTGPESIAPGTDPIHGANGRNAGARFWLPSENEWYKAAYHQPAEQGGDSDHYWFFPTRSNDRPTVARADALGNINNDTDNIANYHDVGRTTTVGSGGPGSQSYYRAADMGGNVWEWNEQVITGENWRGLRGGSLSSSTSEKLRSFWRHENWHTVQASNVGFRVAGL